MIGKWISEALAAWRAWQGRHSNASAADIEAVDDEWQKIDRLGEAEMETIRRIGRKFDRPPTKRITLKPKPETLVKASREKTT